MTASLVQPQQAPSPPRCLSRAERQYLDAVYGVVKRHGNSVALTKLSNPTCPDFFVPRLAAVFPGRKLKVVLESEDDRLSIQHHENGTCIVCAKETERDPWPRQQPPANTASAVVPRSSSALSLISQFRDLPADPLLTLAELYPLLQYVHRQLDASSFLGFTFCTIDRSQILLDPPTPLPNSLGLAVHELGLAVTRELPSSGALRAATLGVLEQPSPNPLRVASLSSFAGCAAQGSHFLNHAPAPTYRAGVYGSPFGTPPPPPPVPTHSTWAPLPSRFVSMPLPPKPASGVEAGEFDGWWQQLMSRRAEQAAHSQQLHRCPPANSCGSTDRWGWPAQLRPYEDDISSPRHYVPSETTSGGTGEDDCGSASE
jgi:hypothetical protein